MLMTAVAFGLVTLLIVLVVAALLDCVRTPRERVRYVPKWLWLLFLLHAPVFGALVWNYAGKRPERPA
ncbi:PLD nuclease N-terminal domain-containing protein [Streptomyces sp. 900105755]|uniref:PLD nuclease N-terminal domain-containing protein n=1 Tax=unclassified Streptomyces TaxID=2593676 RepID=UPI00089D55E0|nr:PLD nuclease N-terminal domain-containing protein [Streptomyces sp. Ag109_O5-10]SEE92916.1 Phospholipase_D-nuclease N-terminal [Streptomyces sp. Ag109_O5-10]